MFSNTSFFHATHVRGIFSLKILGITVCLLASPAVWAQAGAACDAQSSSADNRNACVVQRFQETDTANNILYGDVMRALSAHERPALRKDQTQWIQQRTRQCKQQHAGDEGQENWSSLYHQCLILATQSRRADLMHWLHHGEAPTRP